MDPWLARWTAPRRERLDAWMTARFSETSPARFGEACRYPIETGGKRFRPLLTLAAAESLGAPFVEAELIAVGAAVELVHTYSLVHDDLPAMDDDDTRRGRPTAHKVYGEAPAILVGDALLTEAFAVLAGRALPPTVVISLVAELAASAGPDGMVGGQAFDIGMGGPITTVDGLLRLHAGKTGALIRGAVRLGALAAEADPEALARLSTYGSAIGLAFQMADDVLDAEQDAGEDGPPSYVKLLGVEGTRARAAELLEEALAAIAPLPEPHALAALAHHAVERSV